MNLKYLGWPHKEYIKTAKKESLCEEFLSKNDVEVGLANFWCYDYGANTSEAVQKDTSLAPRTLELYANSLKDTSLALRTLELYANS